MIKKILKYFRWINFYFSQTPFYAIFYVTSRCNARCSHCFNWKLVDDASQKKELSLSEIEKIAKKWGRMLIINLAGGEPYLRDDLPEIVKIFKKHTGVEIIAIPSNGLLTDKIVSTIDQLLRENPDLYFRFTFSIDGFKEIHNKIRGIEGIFDKVVDTISEVKKLKRKYNNFSLFSNSCFMRANQDTLLDTLKFIKKELDVDAMSVTYIRGDARISENQKNLYQDKYQKIIKYLSELDREKFKGHPMSSFIWAATNFARYKVLDNLSKSKRNFECYAIRRLSVIEDNGDVRVCEILPTKLGNLRDYNYDINKIINTDFAKKEYLKIKNHNCNCTWECAVRTGIIYNFKEYPLLLKWMFKL